MVFHKECQLKKEDLRDELGPAQVNLQELLKIVRHFDIKHFRVNVIINLVRRRNVWSPYRAIRINSAFFLKQHVKVKL